MNTEALNQTLDLLRPLSTLVGLSVARLCPGFPLLHIHRDRGDIPQSLFFILIVFLLWFSSLIANQAIKLYYRCRYSRRIVPKPKEESQQEMIRKLLAETKREFTDQKVSPQPTREDQTPKER